MQRLRSNTCGPGKFKRNGNCNPCPVGHYRADASHTYTSCVKCPPGTAAPRGSSSCTSCHGKNQYAHAEAGECRTCNWREMDYTDDNQFWMLVGTDAEHTHCFRCNGKEVNGEPMLKDVYRGVCVTQCPPETFAKTNWLQGHRTTACVRCQKHKRMTNKGCKACPKGHTQGEDGTSCRPCPIGAKSTSTGCESCGANKVRSAKNSCVACPAGFSRSGDDDTVGCTATGSF